MQSVPRHGDVLRLQSMGHINKSFINLYLEASKNVANRATHVILLMVIVSSVLINTPSMFACRIM